MIVCYPTVRIDLVEFVFENYKLDIRLPKYARNNQETTIGVIIL